MKFKDERPKRYFRDAMKLGGTGKKQSLLGRTFSTKFFLKFCSDLVEPSFICFQILSYEPEDRMKEDIEKAIPWLKNLEYFYKFISLKETKDNKISLLNKLTWVLYRKVYKKNSIIKRAGEKNKIFYLILQGNVLKLDIVLYRQLLSLEEYLIYLIKMKLLNEKEIINKCIILNKTFIDVSETSIKLFCIKNHIKNYESMKIKAIKDLNKLGMNINENFEEEELINEEIKFKSVDNYLKIFEAQMNPKREHEQSKAYYNFYLAKYVKNGKLNDGIFFGNFLKDEIKENSTYIAKDKCNIGTINKEIHYTEDLYESILNKKKNIFHEIKHNFFIFHHIKENILCDNYASFMVYKKYYKGDKIFIQNSCYEGVFFIQKGEIKISVNASIDDLYDLITYLTYGLNGFNEYVSGFTSKDYIDDQLNQQNQRIKTHRTLDNETAQLYLEKNNYELMKIEEYNIIGTNELYDHLTGIYNFSAECISDEAVIYFLPKENLNILLNREKMVYNSFIQLVEFRIKDIIWKIKEYIKISEKKINKIKSKKIKLKRSFFSEIDNNKNNDNKNLKKNNSIKNVSNIIKRNDLNCNIYNQYKHFFLSQDTNKETFYTFRKSKNIFYSTPKMPSIINKEKNRNYKHRIGKYSYSKTKKILINSIPENFPFLIMDKFVKREFSKLNKFNILEQIKTTNNIKPMKIKKLYINNFNFKSKNK